MAIEVTGDGLGGSTINMKFKRFTVYCKSCTVRAVNSPDLDKVIPSAKKASSGAASKSTLDSEVQI